MYKNQLQELAQRSCFNLPSYTSIREGPDHAPRFKVSVNFNGESFESPTYCSTLRQAEHSAAEVALNALAGRGPSNSLAARILDETGVYKNLLQEVSQKVGATLPTYTTIRSGAGHLPVFRCTVELAGVIFNGEPAKSKKQAEKNAAMAAWLSLKALQQSDPTTGKIHKDELEHVTVARALQKYLTKNGRSSIPIKFPTPSPRPSTMHQPQSSTSKILPFICSKSAPRNRPVTSVGNSSPFQNMSTTQFQQMINLANESYSSLQDHLTRAPPPHNFPAAGAAPYIPVGHFNHKSAPPVNIRQMVPVFSAPPPHHSPRPSLGVRPPPPVMGGPPPICMRRAVPVYAASPVRVNEMQKVHPAVRIENPRVSVSPATQAKEPGRLDSHFPKLMVIKPEVPIGSSEVSKVEVKPPVAKAKVEVEPSVAKTDDQGSSPKASARETSVEVQDKLNVSAGIIGLKNLKI